MYSLMEYISERRGPSLKLESWSVILVVNADSSSALCQRGFTLRRVLCFTKLCAEEISGLIIKRDH